VLAFANFELQPERRRLLQAGQPVALGTRAFDVLLSLAERRDQVVTKSELLDLVWPGLVVEENNLQVQISSLRKLLGPHAIATIPGRGYRFTAALERPDDAGSMQPTLARRPLRRRPPTRRRPASATCRRSCHRFTAEPRNCPPCVH
jgi:DNA-binding winged helix-turn-helix (wHTH) protein